MGGQPEGSEDPVSAIENIICIWSEMPRTGSLSKGQFSFAFGLVSHVQIWRMGQFLKLIAGWNFFKASLSFKSVNFGRWDGPGNFEHSSPEDCNKSKRYEPAYFWNWKFRNESKIRGPDRKVLTFLSVSVARCAVGLPKGVKREQAPT